MHGDWAEAERLMATSPPPRPSPASSVPTGPSAPRDTELIMDLSTDLSARVAAHLDSPEMPSSVDEQLRPLADALASGEADQLHPWAEMDLLGLVDPRAIADEAVDGDRRLGAYEQLRSALIFAPIAVTWLGIGLAARAYGRLPTDVERYPDASFLALWERGFDGHGGFSLSLFTIGLIDFLLIACVMGLTVACNRRRTVVDGAAHRRGVALRATGRGGTTGSRRPSSARRRAVSP